MRHVSFTCENGEQLEMRFSQDQRIGVLVRNGEVLELKQQISGSGFIYTNGPNVVRGKGDELTIEMGRTAPIGFHSIPEMPDGTLVETRSELGAPASDGCIRQWITDARALWKFAPDGTTVVVRA